MHHRRKLAATQRTPSWPKATKTLGFKQGSTLRSISVQADAHDPTTWLWRGRGWRRQRPAIVDRTRNFGTLEETRGNHEAATVAYEQMFSEELGDPVVMNNLATLLASPKRFRTHGPAMRSSDSIRERDFLLNGHARGLLFGERRSANGPPKFPSSACDHRSSCYSLLLGIDPPAGWWPHDCPTKRRSSGSSWPDRRHGPFAKMPAARSEC